MRDGWTLLEKVAWATPFGFAISLVTIDFRFHASRRLTGIELWFDAVFSSLTAFPLPGDFSWLELGIASATAVAALAAWRALVLNLEDRQARDYPKLMLVAGKIEVQSRRPRTSAAISQGSRLLINIGLGPATHVYGRLILSRVFLRGLKRVTLSASSLDKPPPYECSAGLMATAIPTDSTPQIDVFTARFVRQLIDLALELDSELVHARVEHRSEGDQKGDTPTHSYSLRLSGHLLASFSDRGERREIKNTLHFEFFGRLTFRKTDAEPREVLNSTAAVDGFVRVPGVWEKWSVHTDS